MTFGWEDWHMWLDVFKRNHSLCILKDVLVLYRTKEDSMIHEANKHGPELQAQMIRDHSFLYDLLP